MGNGCGGNGNCCGNNDVGDSNINRMAAGAAMMMTMTAAAAAVATAVTIAVTMMVVVVAVAEAASVTAPMVRAKANPQRHPNPQQYFRFIPFWNIPPVPNNLSYSTHIGNQYQQKSYSFGISKTHIHT